MGEIDISASRPEGRSRCTGATVIDVAMGFRRSRTSLLSGLETGVQARTATNYDSYNQLADFTISLDLVRDCVTNGCFNYTPNRQQGSRGLTLVYGGAELFYANDCNNDADPAEAEQAADTDFLRQRHLQSPNKANREEHYCW